MQTSLENKFDVENDDSTFLDHPEPTDQIPLSFAQERLWFFSQLESDSALYNVPSAVRLKGGLDVSALEKSFNVIVQRHEALRTNFISDAGNPVQIVRDETSISLLTFDLSKHTEEQRESEAHKWLELESQKPFDLENDSLLRVGLIRFAASEHILFLNLHHIVSDEWSLRVLFQELTALYPAFATGKEIQLPELPVQYADFALWQRECLSGENLERDLEYWKQQLNNDFAPLELPTDHPRPAIQTYRGATEALSLSKNLLLSINELSQRENATLFMTLLAAFNALLHRWTGQEQITIGSPISGRNKVETENLIGFFVNTLPLRTTVSEEISFRELLGRVREVTLGAYAHQDLPFEKLIAELQPQRDAGNLSFLQAMFALQNASETDLSLPGIESEFLETDTKTAKFDLTFVVRETHDGLKLIAEYNADLFECETILGILEQYGRLLESAANNPEQKIFQISLLNATERQRVLCDWNNTATAYPRDKTISQLFEEQAKKTPDKIALIFGEDEMTYRELDERSNQLGNYLRGLGVGPDVLVTISAERSLEMMVGFLGILKAGGAYVPLDLDYPAERIAFMIEDARSPVLLTQARLASRFDAHKSKLLCLDSDWEKISREQKFAPSNGATSENLAYVIYTSGSTGQPKGVAVPHRAISRLVFNTNYIQLDSSDRMAQASNSSFDAATFEIWGALLHGGTLVGFNKETILSPRDFATQLAQQKISTLFLTTALFNQIAPDAPHAFGTLKNVLFGGEAVDPKSVRKILTTAPPQRLLHVYGPTESTTFASSFEIKDVAEDATTIPIGRPLSNTTFHVLDWNLQPVPIGVPGELHLGGDGLARGYFNRPELTAAKFIANPLVENSLLYKTGDLVRYLPDGNIEFIGRIDHQVKIRGFRIELQEIEALLRQHPAVKDALVLVRGENADKQLIGYLVSKNPALDTADLRRFLKRKLPDYMVPFVFVSLEQFPLNANGKVDRRALPAPDFVAKPESKSTPLTKLEQKLKEIWETVLGRKQIKVSDNFFELGGHSLLAVRLFAQIEKSIGKKLPLALLFQSPTIEQLARAIEDGHTVKADSCVVEIQPNGSRPPIFWLHTLGGGGGGGVLRYQKLAQLLGPDQPSYGLVAPPEPFTKIETMSEHYIRQMRIIQPSGPYQLGGYCFGGVVAFEIAQQLRAQGEEVGVLAVLDSYPPNVAHAQSLSGNVLNLFSTLPERARRLFQQDPSKIIATIKRKSKKMEKLLMAFLHLGNGAEKQNEIQLEDVIDMANYPKGYERFAKVHWKALVNYFPKPYPGKVALFETTKTPGAVPVEMIWRSLALGGLEVRKLPCPHETMLEEPNVQMLANELNACLEQNRHAKGKYAA